MLNRSDVFELILAALIILFCLFVSLADILFHRIPNRVLLTALPLLLIFRFVSQPDMWSEYLYGGLLGLLLLLPPALLFPDSVGMGDVKLLGVLGCLLGWQNVVHALLLASLLAFFMVLLLLILKKMKRNDPIPFAPFLSAAALIVHFTAI